MKSSASEPGLRRLKFVVQNTLESNEWLENVYNEQDLKILEN